LLASIPTLDTEPKSRLSIIEGMVPGLMDLPPGCRFANRCEHVADRCNASPPDTDEVESGHQVACYRWREI
jgi:peptide/nickel transport system ATP-binding protein